ncbi:glycosyl transferase [Planotetraspora thailandica]|uniref:Glycosyl transferase n=1 Tax=Planotetraspora thailandica TaxID=487172 RepID=A0A8J3V7X5_9ACTN|nr:glycosyltransferase [Planotetraspora thailandica]GII57685.1 glycosyl transferase [Planotetraspora thailandica]
MRVLIIGIGTRGDVAPYTGLGVRLRDAGHEVAIAAHTPYSDLVTACGLEFRPVAGDPLPLLPVSAGGARMSPAAKARMFAEYGRLTADGILAAAEKGTDVLLLGAAASAGYHVAEAMEIPSMGVHLQPIEPTGDFPPVTGAFSRSLGRRGNRAAARMLFAAPSPAHAGSAKHLRARLGLPPVTSNAVYRRREQTRWPVYHGHSAAVLPRPADWREGLEVAGYWWPERAPGWRPPTKLLDFLESGPPPVYVGFGSMGSGDLGRHTEIVLAALRQARLRGVLQTGAAGLAVEDDDVLGVGDVPHEWLFPRMAAVAHHAGSGTTAAGIRAGVPAVGLPVMGDQRLWAGRLAALGVGPGAIPIRRLSAPRLAAALSAAVADPSHRRRAADLAERVGREDGARVVVEAVERLGVPW